MGYVLQGSRATVFQGRRTYSVQDDQAEAAGNNGTGVGVAVITAVPTIDASSISPITQLRHSCLLRHNGRLARP
jgi:hypothetical protein